MAKVIFLKGLPASGKTTWAKEYVNSHNAVRVNKDDLRAMLGQQWSPEFEQLVGGIQYAAVEMILQNGYDVIIDDTNFNPAHEKAFRDMVWAFGAEFIVKEFDTPLEVCLARNAEREGRHKVPESVIIKMYNRNYGDDSKI